MFGGLDDELIWIDTIFSLWSLQSAKNSFSLHLLTFCFSYSLFSTKLIGKIRLCDEFVDYIIFKIKIKRKKAHGNENEMKSRVVFVVER